MIIAKAGQRRGGSHAHRGKSGQNSRTSNSSISKKPPRSCNWCGDLSHWMLNCPALTKELARRAKDRKTRSSKTETVNLVSDRDSDTYSDNSDASSEGDEVKLNALEINLARLGTDWYLDSGASKHITGDSSQLTKIKHNKSQRVKTADGRSHQVYGTGNVTIPIAQGVKKEFTDVLYLINS